MLIWDESHKTHLSEPASLRVERKRKAEQHLLEFWKADLHPSQDLAMVQREDNKHQTLGDAAAVVQ